MKVLFPPELWYIIKDYMFHDIKKHGKHLKDDNNNILAFNSCMNLLPRPFAPKMGPRIVYSSVKKDFRMVTYLYYLSPFSNSKYGNKNSIKCIIVKCPLKYYYCVNNNMNDNIIRNEYYSYIHYYQGLLV
jgi:hypothetical protein